MLALQGGSLRSEDKRKACLLCTPRYSAVNFFFLPNQNPLTFATPEIRFLILGIKKVRVVAQPGSALVWGARGRWFESSPPDQIKRVAVLQLFFISKEVTFTFVLSFRDVAQPGSTWRLGARAANSKIMFFVYILWSSKIGKFYVGSTTDVQRRLLEHNGRHTHFTANGQPWSLIWQKELNLKAEGLLLEQKIKKRGARRYLYDIGFDFSGCSAAR